MTCDIHFENGKVIAVKEDFYVLLDLMKESAIKVIGDNIINFKYVILIVKH